MFLGTGDQGLRERPGGARQARGRVWGDVRERPGVSRGRLAAARGSAGGSPGDAQRPGRGGEGGRPGIVPWGGVYWEKRLSDQSQIGKRLSEQSQRTIFFKIWLHIRDLGLKIGSFISPWRDESPSDSPMLRKVHFLCF